MRYLLLYDLATGEITGSQVVSFSTIPDNDGNGCWVAANAYQWERAVRIGNTGLELTSDPVRQDPAGQPRTRAEILQQHGMYRVNRREAYDSISDQLDRITATFEFLALRGIDIGAQGQEQVSRWRAVKDEFPKPII